MPLFSKRFVTVAEVNEILALNVTDPTVNERITRYIAHSSEMIDSMLRNYITKIGGLEYLTSTNQKHIKKATVYLVVHWYTNGIAISKISATMATGMQFNMAQSNPKEPDYIPRNCLAALEASRLWKNQVDFKAINQVDASDVNLDNQSPWNYSLTEGVARGYFLTPAGVISSDNTITISQIDPVGAIPQRVDLVVDTSSILSQVTSSKVQDDSKNLLLAYQGLNPWKMTIDDHTSTNIAQDLKLHHQEQQLNTHDSTLDAHNDQITINATVNDQQDATIAQNQSNISNVADQSAVNSAAIEVLQAEIISSFSTAGVYESSGATLTEGVEITPTLVSQIAIDDSYVTFDAVNSDFTCLVSGEGEVVLNGSAANSGVEKNCEIRLYINDILAHTTTVTVAADSSSSISRVIKIPILNENDKFQLRFYFETGAGQVSAVGNLHYVVEFSTTSINKPSVSSEIINDNNVETTAGINPSLIKADNSTQSEVIHTFSGVFNGVDSTWTITKKVKNLDSDANVNISIEAKRDDGDPTGEQTVSWKYDGESGNLNATITTSTTSSPPEPVKEGDYTTKKYVDSYLGKSFFDTYNVIYPIGSVVYAATMPDYKTAKWRECVQFKRTDFNQAFVPNWNGGDNYEYGYIQQHSHKCASRIWRQYSDIKNSDHWVFLGLEVWSRHGDITNFGTHDWNNWASANDGIYDANWYTGKEINTRKSNSDLSGTYHNDSRPYNEVAGIGLGKDVRVWQRYE